MSLASFSIVTSCPSSTCTKLRFLLLPRVHTAAPEAILRSPALRCIPCVLSTTFASDLPQTCSLTLRLRHLNAEIGNHRACAFHTLALQRLLLEAFEETVLVRFFWRAREVSAVEVGRSSSAPRPHNPIG